MIRVVDLYKSFGENHVLCGASLTVNKGETMVVLGQSGSGKSVLLKLMIGLLKPDSGQILVDDKDITQMLLHETIVLEGKRKGKSTTNIFGTNPPNGPVEVTTRSMVPSWSPSTISRSLPRSGC
jgi:ABC-type branched-subunit amino acid transport system ATPase component